MRTTVAETINSVEKELIEVTQFVPEKRYRKRQDYLGALMRAVCDLTDPQFDELSDEAADWSCHAVDAFKVGKDLPDFEPHMNNTESLNEGDKSETPTTIEANEAEEPQEVEEIEAEAVEIIEEVKPKKKAKKAAKPRTKAKKEESEQTETKTPSRAPRVRQSGINKWGVLIGSKSDVVCQMLARENGATMDEIKEATGHYHYNLCNRLRRHGFKIEKDGLRIRLRD